jgi:Hypothetical glycosyl hydrolase family 15
VRAAARGRRGVFCDRPRFDVRLSFIAALACSATLVVAPSAPAATSAAGHLRVAIDSAAAGADFTATPSRDQFVILQGSETARLRSLKAANPQLTVLLYKNLGGMVARDGYGFTTSGVSTQDADAHPEWYLLDTSGSRITFSGYPWIWAADVGSTSYRQTWAENVLGQVRAEGWDGVFIDDVSPTISPHYDPARVSKYPTDASYAAAMQSALGFVGPALRNAGKVAIANFGGHWSEFPAVAAGWLQLLDGAMDEHFTKAGGAPGTGFVEGDAWRSELEQVRVAESQGKVFLGVAHSSGYDAEAARYGWATTLLAANGHSYFAVQGDYTNEAWYADYDLPIGEPAAAEVEADGIHRRAFTCGLVLVNPTSQARAVDFGGSYTGSGLMSATAATMQPHTGLIMVRDGCPAATSPAPTAAQRAKRRCSARRARAKKAHRGARRRCSRQAQRRCTTRRTGERKARRGAKRKCTKRRPARRSGRHAHKHPRRAA